jgi:YgiT-type zinc finger domain-containing protein
MGRPVDQEEGAQAISPTVCSRCGGTLEHKIITHQQHWGDELYEFENVPALVCCQCGEVWLEAEVAQLILKDRTDSSAA